MARHYSAPRNSPNQGLIWVLGLALLICIAVIAWQAGRLSAVEEHTSKSTSDEAIQGSDSDTSEMAFGQNNRTTQQLSRERRSSSQSNDEAAQVRPYSSQMDMAAASGPNNRTTQQVSRERRSSSQSNDEAAQVRQYFSQMDMAAASASNLMDPNELAQSVLGQALSGDLSGFDGVAAGQRDALRRMKGIDPPAECAEHHRLSIQTMEQAVDVMERMSSSLKDQDMTQMLMLSTRAQSLMDDAEKVDAIGKELEDRYGL